MPKGRLLDDWIKAYLIYTHSSESPEEYHTWVALSTIAGAVRRRCFFNMEYFLLYPNLYVVLVGPPGRCKKSTAMRVGRSFLAPVPGAEFTTDSVTRERLIQDLSQSFKDGHSSMTAFSSEFATLLTSSGMDMVVFLTDIYESPPEWSHKTKMGGTNTIKAPYLNMLAATTPDWIAKSLPLDTVGIGLTSRVIFVYQDTPRRRPWRPRLSPEQVELQKVLEKDLIQISSAIQGEYQLTDAADKFYDEWYQSRVENPNPSGDPRLNGYYERKPMHVLKLAMVIAASRRNELVIEKEDAEEVFRILGHAEERMPKVFAAVGKNTLAFDMEAVKEVILTAPNGIGFGQLMDMFKHSVRKDELTEVLDVLQLAGYVECTHTSKGVIYKPTKLAKLDSEG